MIAPACIFHCNLSFFSPLRFVLSCSSMQGMLRGLRLSMPQGRIRSRQTPGQHRAALIRASAKVLISWQAGEDSEEWKEDGFLSERHGSTSSHDLMQWKKKKKSRNFVTLQVVISHFNFCFPCEILKQEMRDKMTQTGLKSFFNIRSAQKP